MIYSGRGFKDWEIGDIEVIIHNGVYHLFHLIIPNHDYVAHAVSQDGINWKRVKNALFVGDPGEWDDDMIWTMDVSKKNGSFIMYYTGLSMADEGTTQRVGIAHSKDLYVWVKDDRNAPIVESKGPHYEDFHNNPRGWLSFRDPYRFVDRDGEIYLLICGRASYGATHHRGCVSLAKWNGEEYLLEPPLLYPGLYDDVECPCIIYLNDRYYLIGSIREDIKVRYWHAKDFRGPYESFHSDMLLPGGNYAARFVNDGDHVLVYCFYFSNKDLNHKRMLPPPKEVDMDEKGRLFLKPYYRWKEKISKTILQKDFPVVKERLTNKTSHINCENNQWRFSSVSAYQIFSFPKPSDNLIWEGTITLEGLGKFGIVLNEDGEGNAYYISLDFVNGYLRIRTWGFNPSDMSQDFIFKKLQSNLVSINENRTYHFQLINYGHYIELSIDGKVKLSLVDETFQSGNIGFYVASAEGLAKNMAIHIIDSVESTYTDILMTQ